MKQHIETNLNTIQNNLRLHVDRLAGLIGPRVLSRPKTIVAAIGYIENQWLDMGDEVEREEYEVEGVTATNLIVESDGKKNDRLNLLGAHYDTVISTPGADDNASAVAVMLEVSRLLKEKTTTKRCRYVAFACEEPPYFHLDSMGSQVHARAAKKRGDRIDAMLCLEMVGYYRDEPHSQKVPPGIPSWLHRFFPNRGNFLAAVGNLNSISANWKFRRRFKRSSPSMPLFSICLPEKIREIRLSDNSSFWDQGYPALMLTDTSFLRNPHYHLESDTPDKLDYQRMARVVIGVAGAMGEI